MSKRLPPVLWVKWNEDRSGEEFLECYRLPDDAAEQGESVVAGRYVLERTARLVNRTTVEKK